VYGWLHGESASIVGVTDHDALAADLARFLTALQEIDTTGGPSPGPHSFNRGGPVSVWEDQTRKAIDELDGEIDVDGAIGVWESALATKWSGPDVWVHGDVTGSNLLLRNDNLCAVIDFGCATVGDPACDLTPAWTMFEGTSRQRFMSGLPLLDEGTWARARGWALWKALIAAVGRSASDPGGSGIRFGWRWDAFGVIEQLVAEFRRTG
jgi:aminoglycoside phosphotransferase (APT) family kinase protein